MEKKARFLHWDDYFLTVLIYRRIVEHISFLFEPKNIVFFYMQRMCMNVNSFLLL